jgi:hypothetical protein
MLYRRFAFVVGFVLIASLAHGEDRKKLPRVLIIGDSISMGYTEPVKKKLEGIAEVTRPKENCQHTAHGLKRIDAWLGDGKWDVIHFNWGIWDTHMLDDKGAIVRDETNPKSPLHIRHTPEQYRENLVKLLAALEKTNATLVWASTTPIMYRTGKRFDDIKTINAVAADLMKEHKIVIDDLYEYTLPHAKEWQIADKVHFNPVGNENLAKQVSESILAALKSKADTKK